MEIYLVFAGIFAIIGSIVASSKNRNPLSWALVTGLFGMLGLLVLIVQPAKPMPGDAIRI